MWVRVRSSISACLRAMSMTWSEPTQSAIGSSRSDQTLVASSYRRRTMVSVIVASNLSGVGSVLEQRPRSVGAPDTAILDQPERGLLTARGGRVADIRDKPLAVGKPGDRGLIAVHDIEVGGTG